MADLQTKQVRSDQFDKYVYLYLSFVKFYCRLNLLSMPVNRPFVNPFFPSWIYIFIPVIFESIICQFLIFRSNPGKSLMLSILLS